MKKCKKDTCKSNSKQYFGLKSREIAILNLYK
jgi:hypothetical protein